jgi:hypothetical protein
MYRFVRFLPKQMETHGKSVFARGGCQANCATGDGSLEILALVLMVVPAALIGWVADRREAEGRSGRA